MKVKPNLTVLFGILTVIHIEAQGTFRNLDFESATLVPVAGDPKSVQFTPAFPGWTGFIGNTQQGTALYNNLFLDTSAIGIIDQHSSFATPIQGTYTAVLESGFISGTSQLADTTLEQVGLVPSGTQSLLFYAHNPGLGSFTVGLGGQFPSLFVLQATSDYALYGADIHNFAGQTLPLTFTVSPKTPFAGDGILFLDGIQFSTQPIPEPGVVSVFALGILFGGRRFIAKFRKAQRRALL